MRKHPVVEDVFSYRGAAGSFGAKVQLAFALNLIGPTTRGDLDVIRELRNAFAHSRMPMDFELSAVREVCSHLKMPDRPGVFLSLDMLETVPREHLGRAADKNHPRTRYFTACNECAKGMHQVRLKGARVEEVLP